jgi:hypothetical protein
MVDGGSGWNACSSGSGATCAAIAGFSVESERFAAPRPERACFGASRFGAGRFGAGRFAIGQDSPIQ